MKRAIFNVLIFVGAVSVGFAVLYSTVWVSNYVQQCQQAKKFEEHIRQIFEESGK